MKSLLTMIAGLALAMVTPLAPLRAQDLSQVAGAGPEAERAAVLATLRAYLRVTDRRDEAAIAESFHPGAQLLAITRAGSVGAMTQEVWWERVSQIPAGTLARQSVIRLIDVEGNAAIARIDIASGTTRTTDFLSLLRTRAGWRIVGKTLSTPLG